MPLIPIDSIVRRTNNVRTIRDDAEQKALVASMKEHGQLQSVLVSLVEGKNGSSKYELNAGNCRLDAAITLGWKEIDATVKTDMSEETMREINMIENLVRADVHPADYATKIKNIVDSGRNRKELAQRLSLSVGMIGHYYRIASCNAFDAYRADATKHKPTPTFQEMVTIAGRGEEALATYEAFQAARKEAATAAKGSSAEGGEGGEEESEEKGKKNGGKGAFGRQSGQVFYEERKFFRKLCKSFDADASNINPATGKAPTKAEREKAAIVLEVLEWACKTRKDLAAPSEEYTEVAEEVAEETEE